MNATTVLLRRFTSVATPAMSISMAKPSVSTSLFRAAVNVHKSSAGVRFLGAQMNKLEGNASTCETLIEESIKKLMTMNRDEAQDDKKPISNEDLEIRLDYFKKVYKEAELCLSDLRETLFEADDEQYNEECNCAEGALNNAFTAYIDLLEDLQRCSEEQHSTYSEERNTNATNLKRLRRELDQIIEIAKIRDNASS